MGFKILSKEKREQEEADRLQAIDKEITDRIDERNMKLRQLIQTQKRNKIIFITILCFIVFVSLFFGVYNTFIKQPITVDDALLRVIQYQRFNFYNTSGVEGYLKENIEKILPSYISTNRDTVKNMIIKRDTLVINWISTYNNNFANVYFSIEISSQPMDKVKDGIKVEQEYKTERYYGIIPVYFDINTSAYSLAGDITFLTLTDNENTLQVYSNPIYSFNSEIAGKVINPMSEEDTASAKMYLENLLIMYYNQPNSNVSQLFPDGIPLSKEHRNNYTFNNITYFAIYQDTNNKGFNAIVKFNVMDVNGIVFNNTYNISMEKDGSSWKLTQMSY